MGSWNGKVALVTGGSQGLGRETALAFAQRGAQVVIAARDAKRLEEEAALLRSLRHDVTALPADVTRDADVAALVAGTIARYGRLDAVVNAVGRSSRGRAADQSVDDFQAAWEINFLSAVRTTRAVLPHLQRAGGSLVFVGSLASKFAGRWLGAYPPAKFALAGYAHQLRLELAAEGVHVMLVCPGPLERPDSGRRYDEQAANLPPEARQPGGGAPVSAIDPTWLAEQIVDGCEARWPEIVAPWRARLLFAVAQLWPSLADWFLGAK